MKYKLNIWKSPDDGLFRFHIENEAGQTILHKSTVFAVSVQQGIEHFQKSVIADFDAGPEMFNSPKW